VPNVSVIIPTHNRPDRLRNALHSVLDQTERDIEIFVIDDGSADDAAADVVAACRDARVIYIRLPVSLGPAAARNAGIVRATASYIAFLDDDDEWLPEKLQTQIAVLQQSESHVGVVHTACITVDKIAGTIVTSRPSGAFDPGSGRNVITLSSVLMRRICFERVGLFDEELFGPEDFDLWIRIAAESFTFKYVDQPLVRYCIYGDGICQFVGRKLPQNVLNRKVYALERLIAKHRQMFESNRQGQCFLYMTLAERYCDVGDVSNQRKALRRAFRLWPFEPRIFWAFARSIVSEARVASTGLSAGQR